MRRSESRHDHQMRGDREIDVAGGLDHALAGNQTGRGNAHHFDAECLRPRRGIGIDCGVGIILAGGFGYNQPVRADEARKIVDVAIGVIVDQSVAQPQHPVKAQGTRQFGLDLRA